MLLPTQPTQNPEAAFVHECEVCGLKVLLTPEISYSLGWDYPPRMGTWGIVTPRTCGNCGIEGTAWFALAALKTPIEELSDRQLETIHRIIKKEKEEQ